MTSLQYLLNFVPKLDNFKGFPWTRNSDFKKKIIFFGEIKDPLKQVPERYILMLCASKWALGMIKFLA